MTTHNEAKISALEALTGSSSTNVTDLEHEWLDSVISTPAGSRLREKWMTFLGEQGFTGTYTEALAAFLADQGYTGTLDEALLAYWAAGGGGGSGATLAFHAFDGDPFTADVIVGTGSVTEANTTTRYYPDDSGVYQEFTSGEVGETYQGGAWWAACQPALTNQATYSNDQTNGVYIGTGTATKNQTGLRGEANGACLIEDTSGSQAQYIRRQDTIPADSNTHVARWFVRKDSNTSRFPEFTAETKTGGTTQTQTIVINTQTGAAYERDADGAYLVWDAGNEWEVLLSVPNDGSNTVLRTEVYPARRDAIDGGNVNSLTDSIVCGNWETFFDAAIVGVVASSPIFTAGSTVTVNASDGSFDDANHGDTEGAYYFEFRPFIASSDMSGDIELLSLGGSADLAYYDGTNEDAESQDGTNTATRAQALTADTTYNVSVAYGSSKLRVRVNGTWGTEGTYDGAFPSGSALEFLSSIGFTGLIRNIRRYSGSYGDCVTAIEALDP